MPADFLDTFPVRGSTQIEWMTGLVRRVPAEPRAPLRVEGLGATGVTDERRHGRGNQDRLAVAYSTGPDAGGWLMAIVCDGVGGSAHGELAASYCISVMVQSLASGYRTNAPANYLLRQAISSANSAVSSAFEGRSSTTVVALLVTENDAGLGWVGDSRAYALTPKGHKLLSSDDTFGAAVAKHSAHLSIELSEEYADRLSQAVGGSNPISPNLALLTAEAQGDSSFLLCTDGIWKPAEPILGRTLDACDDPKDALRRLLLISEFAGGVDNATGIYLPSIRKIRSFLSDIRMSSYSEGAVVHLPGPTQTVLQVSKSPFKRESAVERFDTVREPKNPKAAARSRRAIKNRDEVQPEVKTLRPNAGHQMVIEEEPSDGTTTPESTQQVSGDKSPT